MFFQKANPYHDPKTGRFTHAPSGPRIGTRINTRSPYGSAYIPARMSILNQDGTLNIEAASAFAKQWGAQDRAQLVGLDPDKLHAYTGLFHSREVQGFNGKPHLVDPEEFESLDGSTFYRGETNRNYSEAMKRGPFYPNTGLHGSGTYATTDLDEALAYTDPSRWHWANREDTDETGGLIRFKLHPNARIASSNSSAMDESRVTQALKNARERGEITTNDYRLLDDYFEDTGNVYAALGYDAYYSPNYEDHIIVLNRTSMLIADEDSSVSVSLNPAV